MPKPLFESKRDTTMENVKCRIEIDGIRLANCTDRDASRSPGMQCVLVTPRDDNKGVFLSATNGKFIAIVEALGVSDEEYLIPKDLVEAALKKKGKRRKVEYNGEEWRLTFLGKTGQELEGSQSFRPAIYNGDDGKKFEPKFPRSQDIIPENRGKFTLALRPEQIAVLSEAIECVGIGYLELDIDIDEEMAFVGIAGNRGIGVVCPINIESNPQYYEEIRKEYVELRNRYANREKSE